MGHTLGSSDIEQVGRVVFDRRALKIDVKPRRNKAAIYNYSLGIIGPLLLLTLATVHFVPEGLFGGQDAPLSWKIMIIAFAICWVGFLVLTLFIVLRLGLGELRGVEELISRPGELEYKKEYPMRKTVRSVLKSDSFEIKKVEKIVRKIWGMRVVTPAEAARSVSSSSIPQVEIITGEQKIRVGCGLDERDTDFLIASLNQLVGNESIEFPGQDGIAGEVADTIQPSKITVSKLGARTVIIVPPPRLKLPFVMGIAIMLMVIIGGFWLTGFKDIPKEEIAFPKEIFETLLFIALVWLSFCFVAFFSTNLLVRERLVIDESSLTCQLEFIGLAVRRRHVDLDEIVRIEVRKNPRSLSSGMGFDFKTLLSHLGFGGKRVMIETSGKPIRVGRWIEDGDASILIQVIEEQRSMLSG